MCCLAALTQNSREGCRVLRYGVTVWERISASGARGQEKAVSLQRAVSPSLKGAPQEQLPQQALSLKGPPGPAAVLGVSGRRLTLK